MADLDTINTAIATTLTDNIDGLAAHESWPEASISPCVIIGPTTADFAASFGRGTDVWMYSLYVLVGYGVASVAEAELNQLVSGGGPRSIRQTIFQHQDLGIANDCSACVTRMTDYGGRLEIGEIQFVGATLELKVSTTGNA